MGDPRPLSPLALAGLALVGEGTTAADLVARFRAAHADVKEETARGLLDELSGLGLTSVARLAEGGPVFALTSLGQQAFATAASGRSDEGRLLTELERLRSDLLSTIAHELRTPLTAVRTSVGILRDASAAPTSEERGLLLETIERNADRMQRLVGDILDLTRFRAGGIQLQLRRFDAVELARSAVASLPPSDRSIHIGAPDGPISVFGDRRRLEQALVNLLSNALKYSPPGSPVRLTVAEQGTDVRWSVSDEGIGITAGDRDRLFERFFVGRNDTARSRDGVGLGLPIALAIVQAHGGAVDVASEPGRGSTFTIAVPAGGPDDGGEP